MVIYKNIKDYVAQGKIKYALSVLQEQVSKEFPQLDNKVRIIRSNFEEWKNNELLGVASENSRELNKVKLAILEICDEILNQLLVQEEKLFRSKIESYQNEIEQLELLLDIEKKALRRIMIFAITIILSGFAVFILAQVEQLTADKSITTIFSAIIVSIGGFSIKNVNDRYSAIKVFKYFRSMLNENIKNESLSYERQKKIDEIRAIIWNTIKRTVSNSQL